MFLRHIILAATTIYYGVLAAPIGSASQSLVPRHTSSLDAREFGLTGEPLALRMVNPVLNERSIIIDPQSSMETREITESHLYYPREPRGKSGGLSRSERQDADKAALRALSSSPGKGPKLTRAEKQDRDKAALRALSGSPPSTISEEQHHHGAFSPPPHMDEHHHVDLASPQGEHHHVDTMASPQVEHHHGVPQQVEQQQPPSAPKPSSGGGGMFSKIQNHWLVTKAKSWFGRSKPATN